MEGLRLMVVEPLEPCSKNPKVKRLRIAAMPKLPNYFSPSELRNPALEIKHSVRMADRQGVGA
jgi:hypothetical protein